MTSTKIATTMPPRNKTKNAEGLTDLEARFVAEFLIDLQQTAAMERADGSGTVKNWRQLGYQMMQRPHVAAAVAKKTAKALNKLEVTAERVLQERARLAFFDARKLFDADGSPVPVHQLDDDTAAAVAGFKPTDLGMEIKLADKNASLTALEKHLGMYREEGGGDGALSIHIHL